MVFLNDAVIFDMSYNIIAQDKCWRAMKISECEMANINKYTILWPSNLLQHVVLWMVTNISDENLS